MNALRHWNQLRWNQLNELQDLKSNLANIFNRSRILSPGECVRVPQWIPPVDVSEDARG